MKRFWNFFKRSKTQEDVKLTYKQLDNNRVEISTSSGKKIIARTFPIEFLERLRDIDIT